MSSELEDIKKLLILNSKVNSTILIGLSNFQSFVIPKKQVIDLLEEINKALYSMEKKDGNTSDSN